MNQERRRNQGKSMVRKGWALLMLTIVLGVGVLIPMSLTAAAQMEVAGFGLFTGVVVWMMPWIFIIAFGWLGVTLIYQGRLLKR